MTDFEKARDASINVGHEAADYIEGANWARDWCSKDQTKRYERFAQREVDALSKYHKEQIEVIKKGQQIAELTTALEGYIPLLDNNDLVRNTDDDGDFVKFSAQSIRIVKVLKASQVVLAKVKAGKQ